MSTQSAHKARWRNEVYRDGYDKLVGFLAVYHTDMKRGESLYDIDVFVTRVVSPAMGAVVDENCFDHALTAYEAVRDVLDGFYAGTAPSSLTLLDDAQENLDTKIRATLNTIGIN